MSIISLYLKVPATVISPDTFKLFKKVLLPEIFWFPVKSTVPLEKIFNAACSAKSKSKPLSEDIESTKKPLKSG